MISKKLLIVITLIPLVSFLAQLRWSEFDNETFNALNQSSLNYTGLLVSGHLWRLCFLSIALLLFDDIIAGFRLAPLPIIVIVAWGLFSIIWSIDPAASIVTTIDIIITLVFAVVIVQRIPIAQILTGIWAFMSLVVALSAVFALLGDEHAIMTGAHIGQWRGLFQHKNVFGQFVSLLLLITLFSGKLVSIRRTLKNLVILLCIFCLLKSNSMTSILASTASIIVGWLSTIKMPSRNHRLILYLSILFVVSYFAYIAASNLEYIYELTGRDLTLTGRTSFWAAVLPLSLTAPLGYGIGTAGDPFVVGVVQQATGLAAVRSVHSTFLQLALELGWLPALIVTIWLMSRMVTARYLPVAKQLASLVASVATLLFFVGATEVGSGIYATLALLVLLICDSSLKQQAAPPELDTKMPAHNRQPALVQSSAARTGSR